MSTAELIKTDKELLVLKHSKESFLGLSLSGECTALHGCRGSTPKPVLFSSPPPPFYATFPTARTPNVSKEHLEAFRAQLRCLGFTQEETFVTSPKVGTRGWDGAPRDCVWVGASPCPPSPRMPVPRRARRRTKPPRPLQRCDWSEPASPLCVVPSPCMGTSPGTRLSLGRSRRVFVFQQRTHTVPFPAGICSFSVLTSSWNKACVTPACCVPSLCPFADCTHTWDGDGWGHSSDPVSQCQTKPRGFRGWGELTHGLVSISSPKAH